jgi:GTP-binding protein
VGKSTLIAAVSAARPKIADYPFTTLIPNLGVVYVEQHQSFVMADLPGLIEGAHEGVGLGHQFLRHVERTRILVHLLDVSGMSGRDPLEDYRVINRELALYSEEMANLPQLVALNKTDVATDPEMVDRVEQALRGEDREVFRISAATRHGVEPLVYRLWALLQELRQAEPKVDAGTVHITAEQEEDSRRWTVRQVSKHHWTVEGKGVERTTAMTDLDNEYGLRRLQRTLDRLGVFRKLKNMGAQEGDTVLIGKAEFEYQDDDVERER